MKTDLPSPQDKYNYDLWTYSTSQYLRDGQVIHTTSLVFNDDFKNLDTLSQRVSEQTNYPVQAGGKLLEETPRTHRKGVFATTGPRKRAKTVGDVAADQTKVIAEDIPQIEQPKLGDISTRVHKRVGEEFRRPPPIQKPISQTKTLYGQKFDTMYNRQYGGQFSVHDRNKMISDLENDYGARLTDSVKKNILKNRQHKSVTGVILRFAKKHADVQSSFNPYLK